jgi:hypothetical protein
MTHVHPELLASPEERHMVKAAAIKFVATFRTLFNSGQLAVCRTPGSDFLYRYRWFNVGHFAIIDTVYWFNVSGSSFLCGSCC